MFLFHSYVALKSRSPTWRPPLGHSELFPFAIGIKPINALGRAIEIPLKWMISHISQVLMRPNVLIQIMEQSVTYQLLYC